MHHAVSASSLLDGTRSVPACGCLEQWARLFMLLHAQVTPAAALVSRDGAAPALRPVVYGRHLESKVLSNFEFERAHPTAA